MIRFSFPFLFFSLLFPFHRKRKGKTEKGNFVLDFRANVRTSYFVQYSNAYAKMILCFHKQRSITFPSSNVSADINIPK